MRIILVRGQIYYIVGIIFLKYRNVYLIEMFQKLTYNLYFIGKKTYTTKISIISTFSLWGNGAIGSQKN
jgi:hypothetical protein